MAFFFVDGGLITGPLTFPIQATEHTKSQSMEARLQSALATLPPAESKTALETMEHLALLKRWFYRSTRAGEIFFADTQRWAAAAPAGAWHRARLSRRKARARGTEHRGQGDRFSLASQ